MNFLNSHSFKMLGGFLAIIVIGLLIALALDTYERNQPLKKPPTINLAN